MSERISLKEAYDDRSVIVKLVNIEDTAIACKDASERAVEAGNTAVESARQSLDACNVAKAEAKASADSAKLSADKATSAESQVSDKVAKTGTSKPQVITGAGGIQVQGDVSVGGDLTVSGDGAVHMDISNIEMAGMSVEKSDTATVIAPPSGGVRFQGTVTVPTTATGVNTQDVVNGQRLQNDLDNYSQMVRTTGSQDIAGAKTFIEPIVGTWGGWIDIVRGLTVAQGEAVVFAKIEANSIGGYHRIEFSQSSNTVPCYAQVMFRENTTSPFPFWVIRKGRGTNNPLDTAGTIKLGVKDGYLWLIWVKPTPYGSLMARQVMDNIYSTVRNQTSTTLTWVTPETVSLEDYTIFDVVE